MEPEFLSHEDENHTHRLVVYQEARGRLHYRLSKRAILAQFQISCYEKINTYLV